MSSADAEPLCPWSIHLSGCGRSPCIHSIREQILNLLLQDLQGCMLEGYVKVANMPSDFIHFLWQEKYQEALDVLLLAEEAFELCNPKHLDMVDNVGLLKIDIVW